MTKTITDQLNRPVTLPDRPRRIISLVPSQTELLFDLGLDEAIVGVTKFCVHPADRVKNKTVVGGTKTPRFDVIDQLQPDLILGNKEENDRESIERLAARYPVWLSDILTLDDALAMIRQVGALVGRSETAGRLAVEIAAAFAALERGEAFSHELTRMDTNKKQKTSWPFVSIRGQKPRRVAYFIWQKPFMVAGRRTFIHDMLTRARLDNAFADFGAGRYPEVTPADIEAAGLDAILLSSEPFPFAERHQAEVAAQFPGVAVHLVDGELFSWYGSRLILTPAYLRKVAARLTA